MSTCHSHAAQPPDERLAFAAPGIKINFGCEREIQPRYSPTSGVINALRMMSGPATCSGFPVGDYDPNRLANQSRHRTRRDRSRRRLHIPAQAGSELSWVAGLTYNFKNPSTQHQNGLDFLLDWRASHLFENKFQIGLVGYYFQQMTDDFGAVHSQVLSEVTTSDSSCVPSGWAFEHRSSGVHLAAEPNE
jgi:Putative MetA-pathway of phenol degradation